MIRAALLTPHLYHGGPRGWMLDLLTRVNNVDWLGVACVGSTWVDPPIVREFEAVTHVYGFSPAAVHCVKTADVLVAWGVHDLDRMIPDDYRGRVVFVSKGADVAFTRPAIAGGLGRVTDWVASSEMALLPFEGLVPRDRITIIPNGVRPKHCTPTMPRDRVRRILGLRPDQTVCAYIGRYSAEKRPVLLAEALALLPEKFVGLWVGKGPEQESNVRTIVDLLGPRAVFCPPVDGPGNIFAAADMVIAPSATEGFGYVQAEALFVGVPLVATPTGFLPEVARDAGGPLWSQTPCDATAHELAAAIVATDQLPRHELHARLRAGQQAIEEGYLVAQMATRWETFLERL